MVTVTEDEAPVQVPAVREQATTPQAILALAVEKGADPASLSKLMDLQERWEANEAKKAYVRAMAAFKQDAPAVLAKGDAVDFTNKSGQRTHYKYTTLGSVVLQITAIMGRHGLSASWSTEQKDTGSVTVTCHITHEKGHSEGVTLTAPPDASGNKNLIQQVGSTVTYLQRYTLLAALGLATGDQDDDGIGAGRRPEVVTPQQHDAEAQRIADRFEGTIVSEPAAQTPASEDRRHAPAEATPAMPAGSHLCPKCGAEADDQRGKTSKAGKKLPAWKCSTGKWTKATGATGCPWVEWDEKFFEKQAAPAMPDAPFPGALAESPSGEPPIETGQKIRLDRLIADTEIEFQDGEYEAMIRECGCASGKVDDMTKAQAQSLVTRIRTIAEGKAE